MYKSFFGLRENPFNVNPDPRFLHRTPRIQEALDQLTYGVQNRKGLILLTGEVGTGKTTLVNYLLDWLHQQRMPTAFIFNSHLNVNHLFDFILADFGVSTDFRLRSNMLLQLNQWLVERFRAGSTPVLIVDEAQGLSFELLEEIRLLLNLETASEKLLQVVLVGQPELEDKLKRPEMRQLRQRIALRCNTAPLTLEESHSYVAERLQIAGASREPVFESDAVEALHYYSRGIPRVLNHLCEHALINAYVAELNPVPPAMVEEAARDFLVDEFRPLSTQSGMANHVDSKLNVMRSTFASELARTFNSRESCSHEEPAIERIAALSEYAIEEPVVTGENRIVAIFPEHEDSAVVIPEENLTNYLSTHDLAPASPGLQFQQATSADSVDAIAFQSDRAAELMETMGRMLEAASSSPRLRIEFPKVKNEPPFPENRTQRASSKNRIPSLDNVNWILANTGRKWIHNFRRLNAWRSSWGILHWLAIAPAAEGRAFAALLPKIRQSIYPVRALLWRWMFDFKRDWTAMINAIAILQVKKSLLQWLREPVSSKRMVSSKDQTV